MTAVAAAAAAASRKRYALSFVLLLFWIAAFSHLTHVTRTAIVVILIGLLAAVSVPVVAHFNAVYFVPEHLYRPYPHVAAVAKFTVVETLLFIDYSVVVLLAVTILFSSQSCVVVVVVVVHRCCCR